VNRATCAEPDEVSRETLL